MSSHSRSNSTSRREQANQSNRSQNQQSSAGQSAQGAPDFSLPTTTVMIYLAGDNNLTDECIYALTELKKAQASRLVKIFVQFDPSDEYLPTQRYEINRRGRHRFNCPLAEDLIDQFPFDKESDNCLKIKPPYGEQRERKGESGTGDPRMLFNFVAFCVDKHPKTDHYVLIICGHGAGIQRDFLLRDNRPDGYLTIYELRAALKLMSERLKGKNNKPFKLDLFGMDVCLMSMAEITYELRGIVDVAIGCESYSPAAGWPYRQTIEKIHFQALSTERFSATDVWDRIASDIVTEYIRFYSDYWLGGLSVSMSALKISKVDDLRHMLRGLANEMIRELREECERKHIQLEGLDSKHISRDRNRDEAPADSYCSDELPDPQCRLEPQDPEHEKEWKRKRYPPLSFSDALVLAHWRTQSYNGELYVDVADFCDNLAQYMPKDSEIAYRCEELSYFIKHYFVIKSCTFGRNYQYSYGVSIYFPWQTLVPYYGASISFPEDSNWIFFLRIYLLATRRAPRLFYSAPHGGLSEIAFKRDLFQKNLSEVRMGPDRMGPDRMGLDEGGNPIHSMRNPPIVFMPDCCTSSERRRINADAQSDLMGDEEFDPKELLRDRRLRELEEANPAWVLLTEEQPAIPEQIQAENEET